MNSRDIQLSKTLSWLLRHGANTQGLSFDDSGFVNVNEILKLHQFKSYDLVDIKRVVNNNDKKRFSLREKSGGLQIRANQGHSLKVDDNELLTLLTKDTVPRYIYHGTYYKNVSSIKVNGLKRMNRNHIHFTSKFPGEQGVLSGMRRSCDVFIVIDVFKAIGDGFTFFESENGVILCAGNEEGTLPFNYVYEIWKLSPLKKIYSQND